MMGLSEESDYENEFRFIAVNASRDDYHDVLFCVPIQRRYRELFHFVVRVQLDMDDILYADIDLMVDSKIFIDSMSYDTEVCMHDDNLISYS